MQAQLHKVASKKMLTSGLPTEEARPARRRRWPYFIVGLAVVLLGLAALRRIQERGEGGSVDAESGTAREVEVVRPEAVTSAVTLPGTYAQVRIDGKRADRAWLVPTAAVLLAPEGARVAVVSGGAVRMRKVELGRDHGSKIEVLGRLTGSEELVANPTHDLRDGSKVEAWRTPAVALGAR
jgi:hypothetical protein